MVKWTCMMMTSRIVWLQATGPPTGPANLACMPGWVMYTAGRRVMVIRNLCHWCKKRCKTVDCTVSHVRSGGTFVSGRPVASSRMCSSDIDVDDELWWCLLYWRQPLGHSQPGSSLYVGSINFTSPSHRLPVLSCWLSSWLYTCSG